MGEATADLEEQGASVLGLGVQEHQGMGTTGAGAVSAFLKWAAEEQGTACSKLKQLY